MIIENRKVKELIPYIKNIKKHPPKQVNKIAESIRQFGFNIPILLTKENEIIAGHGRLLAAKKIKLEDVPCIYLNDLTPEQIKAFRIADNKVAESEWEEGFLKEELEDLYAMDYDLEFTGFDIPEFKDILVEIFPPEIKQRDYEGTEDDCFSDEKVKHEILLPEDELKIPYWEWMNSMDEVYVQFSGGKDSMASLAICLDNLPKDKIKIFHNAIPMDPPGLTEWVQEFAKSLDIELIIPGNVISDEQLFKTLRKTGLPLNFAKRWCLRVWKILPTNNYIKKNGLHLRSDIVFVEGLRREEGGVRATTDPRSLRKIDNTMTVRMSRPILDMTEDEVFKTIKGKGWKRHWVYDIGLPRLGCIFCFATKRRDWQTLRENAPEIFLKSLRILAEGACSNNVSGSDVVYYLRKMLSLDTVAGARKDDGLPPRKPWTGDRKRTDD
jgi:3'-phosphoadenosine 5'-phosphosulfate sulfotransferase (PAPS reductase)/FAD synthetase